MVKVSIAKVEACRFAAPDAHARSTGVSVLRTGPWPHPRPPGPLKWASLLDTPAAGAPPMRARLRPAPRAKAKRRSAPRCARCGCACGAARRDARRASSPYPVLCCCHLLRSVAFRELLPSRTGVPSIAALGSPPGPRCARLRPTRTLSPPRCAMATEVHRDGPQEVTKIQSTEPGAANEIHVRSKPRR